VLAGAGSAAASWQRWINPFLDASREMNVPARLAAGERLYRDVVYYYGPAGPWLEAGAITLFGRRFLVLEAVALLAAVLLFAALWRLTERAGSPLAACVATTWAAALCVGAPNGGSFLFPYSFDALLALAGASLCLSAAAPSAGRARDAISAAGLALALAAKPEVGAAAGVVLLVAWLRASDRRGEARRTLVVLGSGTGAAVLLWALGFRGVPFADLSPEGPAALFSPPQEWRNVYRVISGLADPAGSATTVATALFAGLLIVGLAFLLARAFRRSPRAGEAVWILSVTAAAGFLITRGAGIEDRLPPLLSPMPLLAALATVWILRRPLDASGRARCLLLGFSAAVASRVFLGLAYGAVTTPYSILAVPGLAASAAVLLLDRLPVRLSAPVSFRRALANTLSGFPEAGFFNFVTGLRNPLRQEQIFPGHLDATRERHVIEQIERAGPRYVLLINQPAPAFGRVAFGHDYAIGVWGAVVRRYRPVASFGEAPPDAPVGWPRFFIRVYERGP
jgi:hypothetical protein